MDSSSGDDDASDQISDAPDVVDVAACNLSPSPLEAINKNDATSKYPSLPSLPPSSSPALRTPSTPTTAKTTITAPEPPRWRFVNDAKKSSGYSSFHAGSYIRGRSSEELGAKYVAPDIISSSKLLGRKDGLGENAGRVAEFNPNANDNDEAAGKNESMEVGKLLINDTDKKDAFNSNQNKVGKIQFEEQHTESNSFSGYFAGLPKNNPNNESGSRTLFKQWDVNLHLASKNERKGEWFDGEIEDNYNMPDDDTLSKDGRNVGKLAFHEAGEDEDIFEGEFCRGNNKLATRVEEHGDIEEGGGHDDDYDEFLSFVGEQQQACNKENDVDHGHDVGENVLLENDDCSNHAHQEEGCIDDEMDLHDCNIENCEEGSTLSDLHRGGKNSHVSENNIIATTPPTAIDEDGKEKQKQKWYFIPLLFLLLAAIIGVSVGTTRKDHRSSTDGEALLPAGSSLPIVPVVWNVTTDVPSLEPSISPSKEFSHLPSVQPSLGPSNKPSTQSSSLPTFIPSSHLTSPPSFLQSNNPSLMPSTSPPTQSPVLFMGACPESFVPLSIYPIGAQIEAGGLVYECQKNESCRIMWFGFGSLTAELRGQGWEVVGSCLGTREPTLEPSLAPTSSPTRSPSRSPSKSPTSQPTPNPTVSPTQKPSNAPTTAQPTEQPIDQPTLAPTCSDFEFNLCFAIDMSGSVCFDNWVDGLAQPGGCKNFDKVKEFASNIVKRLDDFDVEKSFSIVKFATDARLAGRLNSAELTTPRIEGLEFSGGSTNTAGAIERCQSSFLTSLLNRKNFIVIITDGEPTIPTGRAEEAALAEASTAKAGGTSIIPIFISKKDNDKEAIELMRQLSSDGEVFDVSDFDSLDSSLQDTLVNEVACG